MTKNRRTVPDVSRPPSDDESEGSDEIGQARGRKTSTTAAAAGPA